MGPAHGGSGDQARLLDHDRRRGGAALFVLNVFRPRFKVVVVAASAYVGLYCVAVWLVPILFQRFKVQPNELALEAPYLKNNIDFTRKAFSLDTIQETSYPALADMTPEVIARNQDTIQNIRLWDYRPLLQMYRPARDTALLSVLPGRCGPLPSARRVSSSDVVGARALSRASRGGPNLGQSEVAVHPWLRFGDELRLANDRRRLSTVHHGEHPPPVFLRPKHKAAIHLLWRVEARISDCRDEREGIRLSPRQSEFSTSYEGKGGIPLDSLWKRLLFAWTQSDVNILFTSYLKPESRVRSGGAFRSACSRSRRFCASTGIPMPS